MDHRLSPTLIQDGTQIEPTGRHDGPAPRREQVRPRRRESPLAVGWMARRLKLGTRRSAAVKLHRWTQGRRERASGLPRLWFAPWKGTWGNRMPGNYGGRVRRCGRNGSSRTRCAGGMEGGRSGAAAQERSSETGVGGAAETADDALPAGRQVTMGWIAAWLKMGTGQSTTTRLQEFKRQRKTGSGK